MDHIVIGLSGVTNSGKTTVSNKLKTTLPNIKVFNMDDYFLAEEDPRHLPLPQFNNYANWEIESAVDFDKLTKDIRSWKETQKSGEKAVLIVEGIIIFKRRDLVNLCDKKYFLTLPKDLCWERRQLRTYLPPEPAGYFEAICWPEYLRHREELQQLDDIEYVDGMKSEEELYSKIHGDIVNALALH